MCTSPSVCNIKVLGVDAVQPTTYIMPCVLWLMVKKPKWTHWTFWFCYLTLPITVAIMIVGSFGSCPPPTLYWPTRLGTPQDCHVMYYAIGTMPYGLNALFGERLQFCVTASVQGLLAGKWVFRWFPSPFTLT